MIYHLKIQNFLRTFLSPLSKKCANIYLNKSYSVMKIACNTKSIIPTDIHNHLSLSSARIAKFSINCDNHMDGAGDRKSFIHYEELLQAQKDNTVLIIDVREQKEIDETGKLPGSIHIPMRHVVNMLNLSNEQFVKDFDKSKPNKDTKIVLSCRSGMRSATVQRELLKLGYKNAYNYIGGWSEWENKQKINKIKN